MGPAAKRQLLPPAEEVTDGPYDLRALRCAADLAKPLILYDKMGEHPRGVRAFPLRPSAGHLPEAAV